MPSDLTEQVSRLTEPSRLTWPSVLVRMLLVVLPGQLLGYFLAITALSASGALRDRPGLSVLITVTGGLLAGVGLGLVRRFRAGCRVFRGGSGGRRHGSVGAARPARRPGHPATPLTGPGAAKTL